jgi:hypothetical protein
MVENKKKEKQNTDFYLKNEENLQPNPETSPATAAAQSDALVTDAYANADIDPLTFRSQDDQEFAAEVAPAPTPTIVRRNEDKNRLIEPEDDRPDFVRNATGTQSFQKGRGLGVTALILSIISVLLFGIVLGPISALMGFLAYRQGQQRLGFWSMALGTLGFVIGITLYNMYY